MAKLADIHVYHRSGGVDFDHKFPCYVTSDGEFSVLCVGYENELPAFVKDIQDVKSDMDRQRRLRIVSFNKKSLETALNGFGRAMLEGETETKLFIYFAAGVSGSIAVSDNGHVAPHEFGKTERYNLSHRESYNAERLSAGPEVALVEVQRTKTQTGVEAFSTNSIRADEAERRDDIGDAGVALAKWSLCHIGSTDWKRINGNLRPYSDPEAARVNHMLERLAQLGLEMAQARDEDVGELFSS